MVIFFLALIRNQFESLLEIFFFFLFFLFISKKITINLREFFKVGPKNVHLLEPQYYIVMESKVSWNIELKNHNLKK